MAPPAKELARPGTHARCVALLRSLVRRWWILGVLLLPLIAVVLSGSRGGAQGVDFNNAMEHLTGQASIEFQNTQDQVNRCVLDYMPGTVNLTIQVDIDLANGTAAGTLNGQDNNIDGYIECGLYHDFATGTTKCCARAYTYVVDWQIQGSFSGFVHPLDDSGDLSEGMNIEMHGSVVGSYQITYYEHGCQDIRTLPKQSIPCSPGGVRRSSDITLVGHYANGGPPTAPVYAIQNSEVFPGQFEIPGWVTFCDCGGGITSGSNWYVSGPGTYLQGYWAWERYRASLGLPTSTPTSRLLPAHQRPGAITFALTEGGRERSLGRYPRRRPAGARSPRPI